MLRHLSIGAPNTALGEAQTTASVDETSKDVVIILCVCGNGALIFHEVTCVTKIQL